MRNFFIVTLVITVSSIFYYGAELRVGIYSNSPKIFMDDHEKPAGILPDILEYIAKNGA